MAWAHVYDLIRDPGSDPYSVSLAVPRPGLDVRYAMTADDR